MGVGWGVGVDLPTARSKSCIEIDDDGSTAGKQCSSTLALCQKGG